MYEMTISQNFLLLTVVVQKRLPVEVKSTYKHCLLYGFREVMLLLICCALKYRTEV